MPRMSLPRVPFITSLCALVVSTALLSGCPQPPRPTVEASFNAAPRAGNVPLTVSFQDTSTTQEGTVQDWLWNFGDGVYSSSKNPVHVYNKAGSYTVSLTVTTAFGSSTRTIPGFIQATERSNFGTIGAAGGSVTASGAIVSIPAGALRQNTVIGVARDLNAFQPNAFEAMTVLSPAFGITRNGEQSEVFAQGNGGVLLPGSIEIRFDAPGVPAGDLNGDHVYILAQLPGGQAVPLATKITGDRARANVLRLPASARYAVVYRPAAFTVDLTGTGKAPITSGAWAGGWRVHLSTELLQQLTALRVGSLEQTVIYTRRNFSQAELNATQDALGAAAAELYERLASSGLRPPLLVNNDARYNVLFYNFFASYPTSFSDFNTLKYTEDVFGNIVVDPRQLIEIAKHNAAIVDADPTAIDIAQELGAPNAIGETAVRASLAGYGYPRFEFGVSDTTQPVNFVEAITRGLSVAVGQTADGLGTARTFGDNEVALLSEPLFTPYRVDTPQYAISGQDFFLFLDKRYALNGSLAPIADSTSSPTGLLEEVRIEFDAPVIGVPPTGEEALRTAYGAISRSLSGQLGVSLAQAYWNFARERAVENSSAGQLRPSDAAREPFTLNDALFGDDGIVDAPLDAPTDTLSVGGEDDPTLGEIPSLASRMVVFELRPQASEAVISFNRGDWAVDGLGNSVNAKVYVEGTGGIELAPNRSSITLRGFTADPEGCGTRVYVLISNLNLEENNSVEVTAKSFSGLTGSESDVLDEYVAACDGEYSWELIGTQRIAVAGVTVSQLRMTTSAWRGLDDVNQTTWDHIITVIEPDNLASDTALLTINGGSTGNDPGTPPAALLPFATAARTVVALLYAVPNQPLVFDGESASRSEDQIIAKSYGEYLDAFEARKTDVTWPVLLPMTRAAVRAMDTVEEFIATQGRVRRDIEDFVVAGASKRGWTTWLTAASDPRVRAIIPLVIDVLNMDEQMEHHFNAYGFYAPAIQPYVQENVFDRLGTPGGNSLLSIVDPYSYLNRLDMPKFIANSTGDQFFLPDSSQFYYDQLPGENYLYYAPNTDHGLGGDVDDVDNATVKAALAWYLSIIREVPRPQYSWTFPTANRTVVTTNVPPASVKLWQATNATARDFRLETIGTKWTSTDLAIQEDGSFAGEVTTPSTGWTAFFIQLNWGRPVDSVDAAFTFTTPVRVVPDVYPGE